AIVRSPEPSTNERDGADMEKLNTTELAVAYANCPRKAFLLLHTESPPALHEYDSVRQVRARTSRERYLARIRWDGTDAVAYDQETLGQVIGISSARVGGWVNSLRPVTCWRRSIRRLWEYPLSPNWGSVVPNGESWRSIVDQLHGPSQISLCPLQANQPVREMDQKKPRPLALSS